MTTAAELRAMSASVQQTRQQEHENRLAAYVTAFVPCVTVWLNEVYAAGTLPYARHWDAWMAILSTTNENFSIGYILPGADWQDTHIIRDRVEERCKEPTCPLIWEDVWDHSIGGCECDPGDAPCTHKIRFVLRHPPPQQVDAMRLYALTDCIVQYLLGKLEASARSGLTSINIMWVHTMKDVVIQAPLLGVFYGHLSETNTAALEEKIEADLCARGFMWRGGKKKGDSICIVF
jgi:hypothetical protein